ncbi:hypothetical protein, partial [Rhizobium sp. Rhizsp42]|uniref:hypothetical protein n=1 Tax=Rhizobium sp. Rhizsp42 TaxID=3243034 RepID=UPI0039B061B0
PQITKHPNPTLLSGAAAVPQLLPGIVLLGPLLGARVADAGDFFGSSGSKAVQSIDFPVFRARTSSSCRIP